ncbi:MAG: hypothetical protein JNK82_27935 [Myxococcaceae bacterium]|nr:hypothetical protein [Myxococcaceae bacterium]
MAHLNITFNGLSADYPLELDAHVTDADDRRIAVEHVRSGAMVALHVPHLADNAFDNFVVDRMQNGMRIYLRPKVPFGA